MLPLGRLLPRGPQAEPQQFDRMLDLSIAAMFGIYAAVGLAGWITYGWLKGEAVDVLITTNMAHDVSGGHVWARLQRTSCLAMPPRHAACHAASPCRLAMAMR